MKKHSELSESEKTEILKLFRTTKDNNVSTISEKTQVTQSAVSRVINDHLLIVRFKVHKKEPRQWHLIRSKKGDEHEVYTKEIDGKLYFVAKNHTTKFLANSVTIINR